MINLKESRFAVTAGWGTGEPNERAAATSPFGEELTGSLVELPAEHGIVEWRETVWAYRFIIRLAGHYPDSRMKALS